MGMNAQKEPGPTLNLLGVQQGSVGRVVELRPKIVVGHHEIPETGQPWNIGGDQFALGTQEKGDPPVVLGTRHDCEQ